MRSQRGTGFASTPVRIPLTPPSTASSPLARHLSYRLRQQRRVRSRAPRRSGQRRGTPGRGPRCDRERLGSDEPPSERLRHLRRRKRATSLAVSLGCGCCPSRGSRNDRGWWWRAVRVSSAPSRATSIFGAPLSTEPVPGLSHWQPTRSLRRALHRRSAQRSMTPLCELAPPSCQSESFWKTAPHGRRRRSKASQPEPCRDRLSSSFSTVTRHPSPRGQEVSRPFVILISDGRFAVHANASSTPRQTVRHWLGCC
jgi:hypothetical protein